MIVRFYLTTGQVFDTKAPEPDYNPGQPYALHEVEEAVARELGGITTDLYTIGRRQVRPPSCVTVTLIGGGHMVLMTAHIVRVQVLED